MATSGCYSRPHFTSVVAGKAEVNGANSSLPILISVVRVNTRYSLHCVDEEQAAQDTRVFVIKNGLRWRDAPKDYGPHKTIYNRFIRWSRLGVFNRIFSALAGEAGDPDQVMIDATHLKAHRTAASLLKKGLFPAVSGAPKEA